MEKKSALYFVQRFSRSRSDCMLRRMAILCTLFALFAAAFPVQASTGSSWELDWEVDLGEGYISTKPVIANGTIFVRSSGFWTGDERPQVFAFSLEGEQRWNRTSATTVQHDLSPLMTVPSGTGPCGSWPELLVVGWADGAVEALRPQDGALIWNQSSAVQGWGITGTLAVDGDHLVVPTRSGLMRVCLADGTIDFEVELGLGWRNGVLVADDGFYIGDEAGTLWNVDRSGNASSFASFDGSIRHPPLLTNAGILVHVQYQTSSAVYTINASNGTPILVHESGPSPAIPSMNGAYVATGDSSFLSVFECEQNCTLRSQHPTTTNGELVWEDTGQIWYSVNRPEGHWAVADLNQTGVISNTTNFSTSHDGYGTASPAFGEQRMAMGNDAGVLMMFVIDKEGSPTSEILVLEPYDWKPVLGAFILVCFLFVGAYSTSLQRTDWAWRMVVLTMLISMLLLMPDLSSSWSQSVSEQTASQKSDQWNNSWPEAWMDTQIVVIEIDGEQEVVGGLLGHETALDLTLAAAQQASWEVEVESTELGAFVVSINGEEGSGWEYFLDGDRAGQSSDRQVVSESIVLQWRLVRR